MNECEVKELFELADAQNCILQECIKTAYTIAYSRMILLIKTGKIGKIVSIDATCTSLNKTTDADGWNSIYSWGPTALLPVFQILGTNYLKKCISNLDYIRECTDNWYVKNKFFLYK